MIVHNKTSFITKKRLLITGIVVVVIAALAIGGWSIAATQAETAFASDMTTAKQNIATKLTEATVVLKDVVAQKDATKTVSYLQQLATELDDTAKGLPAGQTIIDIPLVGGSRLELRDTIQSKVSDLTDVLRASGELLNYEHNVVEPLVAVRSLAGKDANEQTKLAASWQDLVSQLQNMAVPTIAQEAHSKLTQAVQGVQTVLATLPALYTKKDEAGFTAKNKELDAAIANLQSLQTDFRDLDAANDTSLGEKYQALQQEVAK